MVLFFVDRISKTIDEISRNPRNVRFKDLYNLCIHFFGQPRSTSGSHSVFRTPWKGDPRINIQNAKGKAKEYQVKQVLLAIKKLKDERHENG